MDRLEAMSMLLAAVEQGSLSAAARQMHVPVPTLSRKVADLEALLGTQLLTRTTRRLSLTDAGTAYVTAARRILDQVREAEQEAAGEFTAPRGDLVLTAPVLFGRLHVLPVVLDFLTLFPDINVRLLLGDRIVNLVDDHIDMAVRIGKLPDSGMIATRVGSMRSVVCASPALLERLGTPGAPDDMKHLPCIATYGAMLGSSWPFRRPGSKETFDLAIAPRLVTQSEAAVDAAIRGIGFVRLRHYQAFRAIEAGELSLVLEAYEPEPAPIHLVHLPHGQMPLKMRRFLDFATPRLRKAMVAIDSAS